MKMLSDVEIRFLYETAQQDAEGILQEMEEAAANKHQANMEQYERYLQSIKKINARLEPVYQSMQQKYENYEKELAESESEYQSKLAEYEHQKRECEESGEPFDLTPPKKKYVIPRAKPPILPAEPNPPTAPVAIPIRYKAGYRQSAVKALNKMKFLTAENRDIVYQILVKEQYILRRLEIVKKELREGESISEGLCGELLTVFELELCKYSGRKGIILHNLEFEVGNRTIQIDAVFITTKGILIFESKNFSGKVSGAEYMKKWVLQTMNKRYDFYNPIMQNQTHIQALKHVIPNVKCYSLVVFSESCILEYIDIHQADTFVFNLMAIKDVIADIFTADPDKVSEQEMDSIAEQLRKHCADDPVENPNFKETRSYFSSRSKAPPHRITITLSFRRSR